MKTAAWWLAAADNLAMQGPLQPNGSSTMWTAGFHSLEEVRK